MSGCLITRNQDAERTFIARRSPDLTWDVRGPRPLHREPNIAGIAPHAAAISVTLVCLNAGKAATWNGARFCFFYVLSFEATLATTLK